MFRNQYDSDNTTWSPQGRLFQIEYATEAVKQGSATVGLKSKTNVVLCTYNRQIDELGAYQKKIFEIDSHVGCAISGFSPDGRVLTSDMRTRCIDYTYVYGVPHPIGKLVSKLSSDAQENTQVYGKRPFGVGLLIAGYDGKPRLIETTPSGVCSSYKAQAIGARSQACRTYLEKHFETFKELKEEELIKHGLKALRESLSTTNEKLNGKNCSVAIVGEKKDFVILKENEIEEILERLDDIQMELEEPVVE